MAKCLCEAAKQVLDQLENYNIRHIDGISARGSVHNRDLVQAERNYEKYKTKCKCQTREKSGITCKFETFTKFKAENLEESDFEEDAYGSPEGDCLDCLLVPTGFSKTKCGRCLYAAEQLCLGRITPRAREIMTGISRLCSFCSNRSRNIQNCHCAEKFLYMVNFESSHEKRKIGIESTF